MAHKFNYDVMKRLNDGKQMTDVWRLPAIGRWEKSCGKHPTQKPLALLTRIILACTDEGDWVMDPFRAAERRVLSPICADDDSAASSARRSSAVWRGQGARR